jgi:hypothetical protein
VHPLRKNVPLFGCFKEVCAFDAYGEKTAMSFLLVAHPFATPSSTRCLL